jgi:hypothetical protein
VDVAPGGDAGPSGGTRHASHRFIVYGACAIGALVSGGLASVVGVRVALFAFAGGMIASPLVGLFSPLRGVRDQPTDIDDEAPLAAPEGACAAAATQP